MEESRIKAMNVGLLGLNFMLVFAAFQAMGNIQETILNSAKDPDSGGYVDGFDGDGFTSLAIIYVVFSLFNWVAPSVVAIIGPRLTMFIGGIIYTGYILQIIYPNTYLLYCASAVIGMGAAVIWTAQGNFLTLNSTPETMSRNSGIFWALLQMSLLSGNTYVFFAFQDKNSIDESTRTMVVIVLASTSAVGTLLFLFLRPTTWVDPTAQSGATNALLSSIRLFRTKDMLLLSVTFLFTGFLLSYWSGVYGPSIANTQAFGSDAKSLNGLHGIFVGCGEIVGGLCFGIFGHLLLRHGRDLVVMLGFLSCMVAFYLSFINLPLDSPFEDSIGNAYIKSNPYLAIFVSFLLGLGDSCFNTQIYSILGSRYSSDSASAFAIFKFFQSTSAAIAFFYSNHLELHFQLLIMVIFCIAGSVTFCIVEWENSLLSSASSDDVDELVGAADQNPMEANADTVTNDE